MRDTVITQRGLTRLQEELEHLSTERRREVATRLAQAVGREANRLENADYLDALEEQARLERRIAVLTDRLRSAQVVEPEPGNGRVEVGERVRVRDLDSGERLDLELVGPLEADPAAGRITVASPLGQALVGCRRGAEVEVDAPAGRRRFRILAVETPEPAAQR